MGLSSSEMKSQNDALKALFACPDLLLFVIMARNKEIKAAAGK